MPEYGSFRLDQNVRPLIKYSSVSMGEFQGTEQIFLSRQNQNINERVDRSDLEYSTGKQCNCIEA